METVLSILVADQNNYVRSFLKRELEADGYRVLLAGNHHEIFSILNAEEPPELLILDLNIPHTGGLNVLLRLQNRIPEIPVIVHSVFAEYGMHPCLSKVDALVEKGNPAMLKVEIEKAIRKHYPNSLCHEQKGEMLSADKG